MAMTRDQLQQRLDAYLAAEIKILGSQEYQVGDGSTARRKKLAELDVVRREIRQINAEISQLDAAASGVRRTYYARPAR